MLSDAFRQHRNTLRTRWRRLAPDNRHCSSSRTCARARPTATSPRASESGTSTVYRYLRKGLELLAAMAPTLQQAIAQKEVNSAHARMRGPGERVNAQLKSWKILRKIRSSPSQATTLVKAVQTLILAA
jgi:hypothetical protein